MKRFLALLLLAVAPVFAQEYTPPPTYDPVVEQTYTVTQPQTSLENININGGTALTLYDDGTTYTPIELPFDFYYFGNLYNSVYISQNGFISFTSNANGCCSGNELPFLSQDPYYNLNNSIFAMWSDLADFNDPGNPYYKTAANSFTVGWYNIEELGTANRFNFEISLFSDSSFSINYGSFDYTMPSGRMITSGYQGDTTTEFNQFYYGNDPTLLQNTTYFVQSSEVVPPPPPPPPPPPEEPDPPIAPDCNVNPTDPSCVINALIPDTTDEEFLADTGSDNGSSDGTEVVADEEDPAPAEEEMLAELDMIEEELIDDELTEESLEELLAEESSDDEGVEEVETVAAIKEMVNEEKAAALSDNISRDVLGAALSVAADAVSAATAAGGESASSSTASSDSSSRSTTLTAANETVATTTETVAAVETASETTKEESSESSAVAALEILDTGRQLGQEALAVTLAGAEASATESLSEAESIAAVSSSDSVLASMNSIETAAAVVTEEQQVANNETTTETVTEETVITETTEMVVAENNVETTEQVTSEIEQKEEVKEEVMVVDIKEQEITEVSKEQEEVVVADVSMQQTSETVNDQRDESLVVETVTETVVDNVEQVVAEVQSEQPSAVEFTTVEQAMEVFASNVNPQAAAAEQEELENSIVQQAIASSQNNDEENRMGFAEAEAVTIASDPALANAFNVQPNTANLELLGVLGSRAEEKSDAEVRAEQVVAANKEQQDAINANYMDADQSGIVAAIGSDADVSSYLSQRLTDVPFYKPEDIYKNIVYKDNVRGAYFLEKGNTDTYKKMVEEQYKDE